MKQELPEDWISVLRTTYPRRDGGQGWGNVARLVPKAVAKGSTWNRIIAGTAEYRRECERKGSIGTEMVKQAQTFFGPGEWWDEYADIAIARRSQQMEQRARALGFTAVSAELLADPDALEAKLNQHEADAAERRKQRETSNITQLIQRMKA